MWRLLRAIVALPAWLLLAGCVAPCPQRDSVRVTLLAVSDVYALEPNTLFTLAGDTLSPSLLSVLFRGRQMVEAWNLLGLDAATFGNHEFDFGPDVLRARVAESRFVWLSANVLDRRSRVPFGGARPAGGFLHVSGLRFVFDPGREPGRRVLTVEVGGAPLDPERFYRVALPDFLARGGDGYSVFVAGRVLVPAEHGPGLVDAVLREVERRGRIRPAPEGRIRLHSSGVSGGFLLDSPAGRLLG